ncbi:hypothetical protein [Micromonospora sp.]|uniref:hypothetical protein n=1 Tax=Micromonospora sp. TaxID=1876 RepID=UPI003B3BB3C2
MTYPGDGDGFDELIDGVHRATGTAAMRGIEHLARSRQDAAYRDRTAQEQATRASLGQARAEAVRRGAGAPRAAEPGAGGGEWNPDDQGVGSHQPVAEGQQVPQKEVERWMRANKPEVYDALNYEASASDNLGDARRSAERTMRWHYDQAHKPPAAPGSDEYIADWTKKNRPADWERISQQYDADFRSDAFAQWPEEKAAAERRRLYDEARQQEDLAVIERRESEEARRVAGLPEVGTDRPGNLTAVDNQIRDAAGSGREPGERDRTHDRNADQLWDSHEARLERAQRLKDAAGPEPDHDTIQAAMMADLAFGTAPQSSVAPKDPKAPRRAAPAKTRRRGPRADRQRDQGLTR